MDNVVIIIAEDEGGLYAAVNGKGYIILEETKRNFASLVTVPIGDNSKKFGKISTNGMTKKGGWIAFAISSGNPL